jgi:hypothetical protein
VKRSNASVANPGTLRPRLHFNFLIRPALQFFRQLCGRLRQTTIRHSLSRRLFPSAPSIILGTMRITSDKQIVTTALGFSGNLFATVPVFPLP